MEASFIGFGWRQRTKTRVLTHWALIGFASRPMPPAASRRATRARACYPGWSKPAFWPWAQSKTQIPSYLCFRPLFQLHALPRCRLFDKPPLPPQGGRLGGLSSVGVGFSFPPPPPEGDGGRREALPPIPQGVRGRPLSRVRGFQPLASRP